MKRDRQSNITNATMEQVQDQDQAMSEMSLAMNSSFDTSGFSEYARKFGYSADALREVLTNTIQKEPLNKVVGSRAEKTDFLFSDADKLKIDQCSTVGYNPQEATYSNKVYLLLTSGPSTRAGYTKLQVYHNGKPNKIDNKKPFQSYDNHFVHINKGKSFLTNITILPLTLTSNGNPLNTENHGPATTSTFPGNTIDCVPAYESKVIPNVMMPWFDRHRSYDWPTKETCDMFKSMGCCYVGVGHLKSQEKPLEWRLSPSRQELYLMLNLNPTQYRCYITLKVMKKEFVHIECGDMLSSYHCKTALFYTIENNDPDIWQPHNLIKCVLNCLKLLFCWVKNKYCPNYFIPEENMFETKLIDNFKTEKLKAILGTLISNCLEICLKLMNYWNVFKPEKNDIWEGALELKMILKKVSNIIQCSFSEQRNKIMAINDKIKCSTDQNNIEEIKILLPVEPDYGLLADVLEKRLLYLRRFEHLLSVMRRRIKVNKYLDIHKDITKTLPEDFQYCLKLASIATAQKDYAMCDNLLQKSRHIAYKASVICCCDFVSLIDDKTNNTIDKAFHTEDFKSTKCINSMSILEILEQFTLCLNFIESELEGGIVMTPLHLEAYKTVGKSQISRVLSDRMNTVENFMSLHPVTYMYFLQYKNSERMKKNNDMCVALEYLENINLVSLHEGIYSHPDIILNLLGHIYITKGWYRLALKCFRKSWLLIPVYNTAK